MKYDDCAHCYRTGEIIFSPNRNEPGCLYLGTGGKGFRQTVSALARHSRTDDTLLVPGIPEAVDDEAAIAAAGRFRDMITGRNPTTASWNDAPRN